MSCTEVAISVWHYRTFVAGGNAICTTPGQEDVDMPSKTDELISQGLGKAKAMKGALKGLGGVFRTLMEQHGKASGLLHRIKSADDVEKRVELWETVRAQLLAHERAEMEVIYRELHYDPRTREMAEHHDQEAGQLEQLISQMDMNAVGGAQWDGLFDQLVNTVEHHVSEEEGEIFPKAQDVLGKERTKALDATFENAFDAQLRMA